LRLVVDTNVLVSGLLWSGLPSQLLRALRARRDILIGSEPMLAELEKVLGYEKFRRRLLQAGLTIDALVERYSASLLMVVPADVGRVAPDPEDDMVLGTAQAGMADVIVSGDVALLSVGRFGRTYLTTVREALSVVEAA
jgi:putative PIN family toxin of toxin-antitoxin system